MINLTPAFLSEGKNTRDYMNRTEKILKKKLINLLKDDGQGHHHAKYAKVLEQFTIQIVPYGQEPSTAAVDVEGANIYINQGFLIDPTTFYQLNVILRHELAHYLMMHQIRMVNYLKDEIPEMHLKTSMSIHEMLNIIEDFEISNKRYTKEDKSTVKHLWINGRVISGLVTEDHRKSWEKMSLEEMYKALEEEMKQYNWTGEISSAEDSATLKRASYNLHSYKNNTAPSEYINIQDFYDTILNNLKKQHGQDAEMADNYQEIFDGLKKLEAEKADYTPGDIDKIMQEIYNSKPISQCDIVSPITGELVTTVYSPEEKSVALECLKLIKGDTTYEEDYNAWYQEIMNKLKDSNYTDDQIGALIKCCR